MEENQSIKKNKTGLIVAGLMLGMFVAALDQTVVSTAMGTIVSELGGLDQFVWVTSAYLVAEMAGMPIFGKLSDMFGRKRFFFFGLSMFLIGSILCGTSESMTQLSIYRAIQGIGGGSLMPIAFTIVFDIFPREQRGKMSGLFGMVFGLASIAGPLLGAFITDSLNWRWIFYINLPLGAASILLIVLFYNESKMHQEHRIDWFGALALVLFTVGFMFAIELGGDQYAWTSPIILGLFSGSAVFFLLFLIVEKKASEPIISFNMFRRRLFAASTLVAMIYGIPFMVAVVFMPIFIQGVFGGSAARAGLMMLPMLVGLTVASTAGGVLAQRLSYRGVMLIHGILLIFGLILAGTMNAHSPYATVVFYMVLIGYGVGASFSVLNMAAIHGFQPHQFGSVNATLSFVREFGMTVGIAIFGSVQHRLFVSSLKRNLSGLHGQLAMTQWNNPRSLLEPGMRQHIPGPVLHTITDALSTSIAGTFIWALIPACLAWLFMFFMTGERLRMEKIE